MIGGPDTQAQIRALNKRMSTLEQFYEFTKQYFELMLTEDGTRTESRLRRAWLYIKRCAKKQ